MKPWEHGNLTVDASGHYFTNGRQPFFWLGDTAWLLLSHLSLEEAYLYLKNRQEKGFNVIQATLIHEWPQVNLNQQSALINEDFSQPAIESGYWQHVVKIVAMAQELGLYMALLPTWGGNVKNGHLTLDNVDPYLDFLLTTFKDFDNIIWLLGGDVKGDVAPELFNHMGERLKKESPATLVGFHPFGRTTSSQWFQQASWLDFNLFQSGHRRYDQITLGAWDDNQSSDLNCGEDNYRYVEHDRALTPAKPTVDGEPSYEQIVQGLHDFSQPYWQAWDVRRYAYWSVFAGAAGHTYGANAVMQFYQANGEPGAYGVKNDWQVEMNYVGAGCMTHLKTLMESVDYTHGAPAQGLIVTGSGEKYQHLSVFAGDSFLLAYDYLGTAFTLDLTNYAAPLTLHWFDPLTGTRHYSGTVPNGKAVSFVPPVKLEGHPDWVLVLTSQEAL